MKKIQQWLNENPCKSIARQPCGTECLSKATIEQVGKIVESLEVIIIFDLSKYVFSVLIFGIKQNQHFFFNLEWASAKG